MKRSTTYKLGLVAFTCAFQIPIAVWGYTVNGWSFVWFLSGLYLAASVVCGWLANWWVPDWKAMDAPPDGRTHE